MVKNNKIKTKVVKKEKKNASFWMSIFILVIMVFSIVGFALMSGGSVSKNKNGLPSELELQQFEQNGQVFWGAIRNDEQFVFYNIEGYDQSLVDAGLASKIKKQNNILIYVDSGFNESSSVFLVERALRGIKIQYSEVGAISGCSANILVFTNDENFDNTCMRFISSNEEALTKADILVYHLVK